MKILISACLLGEDCKYNGKNNYNKAIEKLVQGHEIIRVCPELLGGLSCPRVPCERKGNRIIGKDGKDYTEQFQLGANRALDIAKKNDVDLVILKKNSPSCGHRVIYDGTFSNQLILGEGVFASLCQSEGFQILEA